jgi:hypothetical protein
MARELLRVATDDNVSDATQLATIKDALDRAGLGANTEIGVTARPYEQVFEAMEMGGSRSEHRRSMGTESIEDEPQHALALTNEADDDDLVVDVEVVDPRSTPDEPEHAPEGYSGPSSARSHRRRHHHRKRA